MWLHYRNIYDELSNSGNVNQYEAVLMKGNSIVQTATDVQLAWTNEIKKLIYFFLFAEREENTYESLSLSLSLSLSTVIVQFGTICQKCFISYYKFLPQEGVWKITTFYRQKSRGLPKCDNLVSKGSNSLIEVHAHYKL